MTKYCHTDPAFVFKLGKAEIWAGSKDAMFEQQDWTLLVSALSVPTMTNPLSTNDPGKALIPPELLAWQAPPVLGIDWPDRGVPRLGRAFWGRLHTFLRGLEGKVGLFCLGGHGRTGTMLSILLALEGTVKGKACPVLMVRKAYCHKAVETTEQIEYIERMTGKKVKAVGSDALYSVGNSYSNGYSTVGGQSSKDAAPFGTAAREKELVREESGHGGKNSSIGDTSTTTKLGVPETLYRWEDETGEYWTDMKGVIVAIAPEEFEDEDEFIAREEREETVSLLLPSAEGAKSGTR